MKFPPPHPVTFRRTYDRRSTGKKVTPIDEPLLARGRIDRLEGHKAFVTAMMTDAGGTVLSEANGLMVKLLPHQP